MSDPQAPKYSRLSLAVLLAVLALGVLATVLNPALLGSPRATFADGAWSSAYQEAYSEQLLWLAPSRAAWNAIDLTVFDQAPEGVLTGSDGWLFTTEEYETTPDSEDLLQAWLDEIEAANGELERLGIALVVAVVPSRAASLPGLAPPVPEANADSYEVVLTGLADLGITSVDLREALSTESAWLRTDTHWTPYGAEAAAGVIAETVRETTPGLAGTQEFESVDTTVVEHEGDLARLLALGPLARPLGYATELISTWNTMPASNPEGGLFDEVNVPATLVGTSYSAAEEWNLAARLRLALAADVLDASASGVGPLVPMSDYLDSDALGQSPPEVVIWEVPVRYLTRSGFLPAGVKP